MLTIIAVPWALKVFYGIITDSFPIFGSTKKNYLILLGAILTVSITTVIFDLDSAGVFVGLITVSTACIGMMDAVVDGLMVMQARIDPNTGSQDL